MAYGTITTLDTLIAITGTPVAEYGEDRLWEAIDANFAVHNAIVNDMLGDLVERTTDKLRRYGGVDSMKMSLVDQSGRSDAQKITAGATVGFPLNLYDGTLQWTRKAFQNMSVGELAKHVRAMFTADVQNLQNEIKKAIMYSTNYTHNDVLVDNVALPVKRLLNADSAPIPIGPNGETFTASSHTHYLATASLIAANLTAAIDTVGEHTATGRILVYINKAQEAAVRALTGFTAYTDPRIIYMATTNIANQSVDLMNQGNRAIGIFDEAEVWVKPWVPANYIFVFLVDGGEKPLAMRTRPGAGDLGLVADDELHPLRARTYEREFGLGVWNRSMAAVLYIASGTYANPSL